MNHLDFSRTETKKIVFVWDGTTRSIDSAENFVERFNNPVVHCVHIMPHESIYSYGTCIQTRGEMHYLEKLLHQYYEKAVRSSQTLRRESRFEVLFGDRVSEIVRFGKFTKANLILTPRFEQSNFSKWVHGDLNERIASKASCPVFFLEAKSNTIPAVDVSAGYHQERS